VSTKLELLPAIDVKDGLAVRLVQGELSATSLYGNPLDVAAEFVSAGAEWIHLVDLDAAFGIGSNAKLLEAVIKSVPLKVELRSSESRNGGSGKSRMDSQGDLGIWRSNCGGT
jgi:phosphoribosylformimino-5-aminoimidazole carboxamide ribonucleotide (ProFAR) isomerase